MNVIDQAASFSRKAHKQQKYGDKPFYSHPAQVAKVIKMLCPLDYELQAAAHFHDILEDTETTPAQLTELFGANVVALVYEVTKEKAENPSLPAPFPHLHTRRGIILKFADRLCNLVNMGSWDEKKQEWYLNKSKFWTS